MTTRKSIRQNAKAVESQVAKFFGTTRTPLSGSNSRHTSSDTLHNVLYIEVKQGKQIPKFFTDIWSEAKTNAKKEGKIPLVALKPRGFTGCIFIADMRSLSEILIQKEVSL